MNLSIKQFQDLLCKNGCGFMARPTLQGYCPKCWADKCLPSSSDSGDEPTEPNLSAMTPLPKPSPSGSDVLNTTANDGQNAKPKDACVDASQTARRKPSELGKGKGNSTTSIHLGNVIDKVVVNTMRRGSSGTTKGPITPTTHKQSQPKGKNECQILPSSIENMLSLSGVDEKPLTFWDVDGGDECTDDVSQDSSNIGRNMQTKSPAVAPQSSLGLGARIRERSPSPELEVLDVKRPEPELITIEDMDEVIPPEVLEPKPKPVNKLSLQGVNLPSIRPQDRVQLLPISPQVQSNISAVRYPSNLQAVRYPSNIQAVRYPSMSSQPRFALSLPTSSQGNVSPVRMPSAASLNSAMEAVKAVQTLQHALSGVSQLATKSSPRSSTVTTQQLPNVRMVSPPRTQTKKYYIIQNQAIPKGMTPTNLQPNTVIQQSTLQPMIYQLQTSAQNTKPTTTKPSNQPVFYQVQTTGQPAPSSTSKSCPIILSKSPVQVTSQASQGSHVRLETHPVSSPKVTVASSITGITNNKTVMAYRTSMPKSGSSIQVVSRTQSILTSTSNTTSTTGSSSTQMTVASAVAAIANNKTVMAYRTSMPKPGSSMQVVSGTQSSPTSTSNTTDTTGSSTSIAGIDNTKTVMANRTLMPKSGSSIQVVSCVSILTSTSNTTSTASSSSPLWADWRKRIVGDKPPSRSSSPVSSMQQQSNYQAVLSKSIPPLQRPVTAIPKPPQPTRLLEIMTAHSATAPKSNAPTVKKSNTPFSALLQHFHDQSLGARQTDVTRSKQQTISRSISGSAPTSQCATGGVQKPAAAIQKRRYPTKPVRRLNRKPIQKCRYCRKHFCGDVRYFRNHLWMHRQKYCPYWYVKDNDDDDTESKNRPQIGRRPFLLLYTPGSHRQRKKTGKCKLNLVCKFCPKSFTSADLLIVHENEHLKGSGQSFGHCKICDVDLKWTTRVSKHVKGVRHIYLRQLFEKMAQSSKDSSSAWTLWQSYPKGRPYRSSVSKKTLSKKTLQPFIAKGNGIAHCKICDVDIKTSGVLRHLETKMYKDLHTKFDLVTQSCNNSRSMWTSWQNYQKSSPSTSAASASGQNHGKFQNIPMIVKCGRCASPIETAKGMIALKEGLFCGVCKYLEASKRQQERNNIRPRCKTCREEFETKTQLAKHELVHTRSSLYSLKCKVCGAQFARAELLATHQHLHDLETPHPCNHCNSRFASAEDLKTHMRQQHPDVKPCICKECSACFLDNAELDKHMQMLHRTPQESSSTEDETVGSFACSYCTETFKDKNNLNIHQKIHNPNLTGEEEPVVVNKVLAAAKPCHICLKCGKEFRNILSLKGHMESHRQSKTGRSNLSRSKVSGQAYHNKSAKAISPPTIKCPTCSKMFKTRQALSSHNKVHLQASKKSSVSKKALSSTKSAASIATSSPAATNELFSRSGILKRILGSNNISAISDDPHSEGLSVTVSTAGESNVYDPNKNVIVNQKERSKQIKTNESQNSPVKTKERQNADLTEHLSDPITIAATGKGSAYDPNKNVIANQEDKPEQIRTKENQNTQQMPSKERQNADLTGKANPDTAMHNVCNERQNAHKIIERQNANLTGKANAHSVLKAMQDTSASQDENARQDASEDKSRRSRKICKCKECNRLFLSKAKLNSHLKLHTTYRPYKCEHCNNRFANHSVCKKHKKAHLPYACNACGESWVTYMGLVNHTVTSHGVLRESLTASGSSHQPSTNKGLRTARGHRCIYCNRRFCREAMRVRSHMRNHKIQYKLFWRKRLKVTMKGNAIGDFLMQTVKMSSSEGKEQADTIDGDEENKELEGDITVCAGSEPKEPQFACDTCGRKYAWKKSLVAHLKKERHGNVVVKSSEVGQNDTRTTTQSSRAQTGASKIIKSSQAQKDVNKTIQSSQPQMGASKITKSSQPQTGASKTTQSHQAQTTQSQKDASKTTQSSQPQPNISKTTQSSQPQPSASKTTKSSQSPNNVKEQSGAPYQCSDCSQTFTLWRLREEHIRRVHKNFTCQYCQKTFLVYQILMKHEKKHKAQGDVIKRQPDVGTGPKDVEKKDTEDRASVAQSEGQKDSQPSEGKHQEQSGGVENTTSPSNPSDKIQKVRLKKEPVSSDDSGASSGCSWEGESGDEDSSSDDSQTERRKSIQQKIKTEKKDELDGDTDEEDDEKVSDFKCKTCGRSFRRKVSLIQHVRVHELEKLSDDEAGDVEENSYKCDQCDRTFNRPVCLTVHKKTHTEKKYKCELCPKSFEKYLLLLRHNRSRHPGHKVIAPGSKVHVEKDQTFVCQVCFEEFPNANKMAEHKKIHSSESKFVCHVCDAVFHQSWDLIVHKRNHSRGDLRQHSIPQAGTSGQSSAITAQATSIPETQTSPTNVDHKCSFCGYVCTNNTHLAQHEEVHRTQFTCTFCGKVFDDNEMLLAHLKSIHYTVRSVDDGKSNMKGKNKKDDTRISHDLTVSDDDDDNDNFSDFGGQADSDSPEEEEDVGRNRYPRRRSVKRKRYISSDDDEDVHEDDNRYPKRTRSRPLYAEPTDEQDLELNLVDDNKEQSGHDGGDKTENEPYKCSYCGIGFMLIDDWSFHEYQHAQNEPFRCQFCYRLFSRRSNLVQHERSHKGSKPYKCLQCGKQFAMDAHLKYHKEQDHANKPKDQSRHEKRSASSPAINPYPHNCGSCGKGFYQRSGLIKHQEKCADVENKVGSANEIGTPNPETPMREKNHACDMCDKRYYKISHLKEHQDRVHSGNSRSMKQKMTSVASPYVGERNAAKRARLQMVADQESSDVDDAADDVNFDAPEVESDDEPSKEAVVKQETDTLYKCRFCPKSFPFRKTLMNHEIKIHQAKGPHTCSSCDVAYWYPYELKRHEESHKKKHIKPGPKEKFAEELSTAFKCHQCNQGFSSQALLLNHQQTHVEQQASIKCKFCLKMFPNEVELQKHEKTHTAPSDAPLSSFGCLFCHEMFTLKSALIDHIQTHSGRESYMCPHCDLTFPTSATLQAHEKEHFQPMLFQCSSCQALFRDKDQLVKHEASHKVNGYPCQFCGLKFIARKGLASHINSKHSKATTEQTSSSPLPHSKKTTMQPVVRLESLPQTLQSSTKATSSYPQQNEDVSSESEEEVTKEQEVNKEQEVDAIVNPYSCNVCKKSFPSPEDLKKHVRSHSKEHSRKCQYCGKEFQLHHVLKKHLKLHLRSLHSSTQDGAGEFKCQLCGIELQTKAGLVSHMKSHARSKAKPFSFHKRSTGFGFKQTQKASTSSVQVKPGKILKVPSVKKEKVSSSSSTSSPEKSPSGSKSVTCNYCNKAVHFNSLKRHIETIHAKDRPRKCQECDERFATKNELWDHVKKAHGGDGPSKAYGCDYCTSRYSSFINLTNHMDKAHPGATVTMGQQEIFRCKFCSKAFAQKKYVRRHELIHLRKGDQIPRNKAASSSSETPVTPPRKKMKMSDERRSRTVSRSSSDMSPPASSPREMSAASPRVGSLHECRYCSFQFVTLQDLKRHERTHPGEKPYSCDDCPKSYHDRSHLTQHRMRMHSSKSSSASGSKESQVMRTSAKEKPNEQESPSENMFHCKLCTRAFLSNSSLNKHLTLKHKTPPTSGRKKESQVVKTSDEVHLKEQRRPGDKMYHCKLCTRAFHSNSGLYKHTLKHETPPTSGRNNESQVVKTSDEVHLKEQGTPGDKMYHCKLCTRAFHSSSSLNKHLTLKHKTKSLHVGLKSKSRKLPVETKSNITGEVKVAREKSHACSECDKRYYTYSHLREHFERIHLKTMKSSPAKGEQMSPPKTESSFTTKTPGETNVNKERFACGKCDKRFYKKSLLKIHIERTHRKRKEVKPETEQSSTESEYTLYSCNICGRSYYSEIHLKDHYAAIHNVPPASKDGGSSEKTSHSVPDKKQTFPCNICGYNFTLKGNLDRHMKRQHAPKEQKSEPIERREQQERLFSCEECNMRFKTEERLEEHYSKVHEGKESQSDEIGTPKPETPVREKNHACDMCDKRYYKASHLKEHQVRIHSGNSRSMKQKMTNKGLQKPSEKTPDAQKRKDHASEEDQLKPTSSQHQLSSQNMKIVSGNRHSPINLKVSKPKKLHIKTSSVSEVGHIEGHKSSTHSMDKAKSNPSTSSGGQVKEQITPSQALYACHVCERTFSLRNSLAHHFQKHHS